MGSLVVKLGSSIVVDERGEPRLDVLGSLCDQLEALHRAGREPVIVTSGAIARGMGVRGAPLRPRAIDELQAASAVEALEGLDIGHATSALGSGGMRSKVVAAEMATAAGIPAVIASGLVPGTLVGAAAGDGVGTRFEAREGRYSSFKLWLKYAKP